MATPVTGPNAIITSPSGAQDSIPQNSHTPVVVAGGYKEIVALNPQITNPDLIYPGQTFKLPGDATYNVVAGDNLTKIAAGKGGGTYTSAVNPTPPPTYVANGIVNQDDGSAGNKKVGDIAAGNPNPNNGVKQARTSSVAAEFVPAKDWRVRLRLAPSATYFYKSDNPGILAPLAITDGLIFPYSPTISLTYAAHYDPIDLVHTNYKGYQYKNSSIDTVTITADFTAQDTSEANYLLAAIHFLRSASKMFYGQDNQPPAGTPPPLLYLSGYGAYQFDNHPLALTSFAYTLPTDVDYINANITTTSNGGGVTAMISPYQVGQQDPNTSKRQNPFQVFKTEAQRLLGSGLRPGAAAPAAVFLSNPNVNDATRVPTKIQMTLTFIPIVTRDAISNYFSLQSYATGQLLRGSKNTNTGGGIW